MEFDNSDHSAGVSLGIIPVCLLRAVGRFENPEGRGSQRYKSRVLQTIQMKLILLSVWAERAVLGNCFKIQT